MPTDIHKRGQAFDTNFMLQKRKMYEECAGKGNLQNSNRTVSTTAAAILDHTNDGATPVLDSVRQIAPEIRMRYRVEALRAILAAIKPSSENEVCCCSQKGTVYHVSKKTSLSKIRRIIT
jgi:hypothetical protein